MRAAALRRGLGDDNLSKALSDYAVLGGTGAKVRIYAVAKEGAVTQHCAQLAVERFAKTVSGFA
jgi:hypothetical protein